MDRLIGNRRRRAPHLLASAAAAAVSLALAWTAPLLAGQAQAAAGSPLNLRPADFSDKLWLSTLVVSLRHSFPGAGHMDSDDLSHAAAAWFGADFAYPGAIAKPVRHGVSRIPGGRPPGKGGKVENRFAVSMSTGSFRFRASNAAGKSAVLTHHRMVQIFAFRDGPRAAVIVRWDRRFVLYAAENGQRSVAVLWRPGGRTARFTASRAGGVEVSVLPGRANCVRMRVGFSPTAPGGVGLNLAIGALLRYVRHLPIEVLPSNSAIAVASPQSWLVAHFVPRRGNYELRSLCYCATKFGKAWKDWRAQLQAFVVRRRVPQNSLPTFNVGLRGLRTDGADVRVVGASHFLRAFMGAISPSHQKVRARRGRTATTADKAAWRLLLRWSGFGRCRHPGTHRNQALPRIAAAALQPVPIAADVVKGPVGARTRPLTLKW